MDEHPLPNSNKTVRDILLEKHPEPTLPPESVLMEGEPVQINPIIFEYLTPHLISLKMWLGKHAGPPVRQALMRRHGSEC